MQGKLMSSALVPTLTMKCKINLIADKNVMGDNVELVFPHYFDDVSDMRKELYVHQIFIGCSVGSFGDFYILIVASSTGS